MTVLPADVPTGLIKGQYYFVNADSVDADTDPDLTVVTGSVVFTCMAKEPLRMPSKAATIIPLKFNGEFDAQGRLVAKGRTEEGIKFPATDSALLNPTGFTWKVEFNLRDAASNTSIMIPSFEFQVPTGSTQDLTLLTPVATSPGVITIQGPAGPDGPAGGLWNFVSLGTTDPVPLATPSGTILVRPL